MTDGLLFAQQVFSDQVTSEEFSQTAFYMLATAAVVLAIGGMCLVDLGLVQRKNVLDTCMQKLIGSLIGGFSFAIVGYAVWNWQYNTAFEVPNSLGQSISDWWLGGTNLVTFSQNLDPAVVPHADVLQVFLPFNMAFAAVVCSFIHSIGIERMKASAFYIICGVVGGVIFPVVLYLMWGSVSPLTARGVHDFVGVFPLYIFVGFFGLLLAWRLGPRLGAFSRHAETAGPAPYNQGLTAVGVGLLLFAISIFAMGCGFFIPGEGYYGITWTTSGLGITISNVVMAFCAGALGGAVVGYLTRNLIIAMTGPLAGWIAIASGADILKPWEVAIISGVAPIVALIGYTLLLRLRVDEKKIVPLGLFVGVYGCLAVGLFAWGTPTGGYPGIDSGTYAFQGAEVNVLWQAIGIAGTAVLAIVAGGLLIAIVEKTVGLRVNEADEIRGLDLTYWDMHGCLDGDVGATMRRDAPPAEPKVAEPV